MTPIAATVADSIPHVFTPGEWVSRDGIRWQALAARIEDERILPA